MLFSSSPLHFGRQPLLIAKDCDSDEDEYSRSESDDNDKNDNDSINSGGEDVILAFIMTRKKLRGQQRHALEDP